MARKLFDMIEAGAAGIVDKDVSDQAVRSAEASGATGTGRIMSATRLSSGLMDLHSNTIRDLDPETIMTIGAQDRLSTNDETIRALADSIKEHGQHVPIMVRPLPDRPDRYQVVYGRRRLAAVRLLGSGQTVKAIVRTLSETAAIIAQGQENNQRLDPSMIEKALFACELRRLNYDVHVVSEALSVDRFTVAKYVKIAEDIPLELIETIGPAHDVGRRPWRDLADIVLMKACDPVAVAKTALQGRDDLKSSERFRLVIDAIAEASSAPPSSVANSQHTDAVGQLVESSRQRVVGSASIGANPKFPGRGPTVRLVGKEGPAPRFALKTAKSGLTLSLGAKDDPAFRSWIEQNIEEFVSELQDKWIRESGNT